MESSFHGRDSRLPTTSQSQISFFLTNQPSNHSNFTVVFNIPILARMFAKSFLVVSVLFSSTALVTQLVQGIPTDSPPPCEKTQDPSTERKLNIEH
ncbi:hypothetical protein ABKN59_007105 [Abortiporus biennis]